MLSRILDQPVELDSLIFYRAADRRNGVRKIVRSTELKDEKRARLVQAAIEEFSTCGLENASYNRIIERSGLSKGSVYYHFDNKDALLGMVMEEIGERVLEAVPERPLPTTREGFWEAVWDYRQREFNFFASNASLGRILIMSLGGHDLDVEDLKGLCVPISRLIERQTRLIRRGQELGAVRRDLDEEVLFRLMRALDKTLCLHFFGPKIEDGEGLPAKERRRRSQEYNELFRDLAQRMLEPAVDFSEKVLAGATPYWGEAALAAQF